MAAGAGFATDRSVATGGCLVTAGGRVAAASVSGGVRDMAAPGALYPLLSSAFD